MPVTLGPFDDAAGLVQVTGDGCAVPNSRMGAEPAFSRLLSRSAVLADQAAENLPALDTGGGIDCLAGSAQWGFLLQALMRTMPVIVPGVPGQDLAEMPLAEHEDVVQALRTRAGPRPAGPPHPLRPHPRDRR